MSKFAHLHKKLETRKENEGKRQSFSGAGPVYPFWNIEIDDSAVVRFLPDGNKSNEDFWVEKCVIKLPFPSIKGEQNTSGRPILVEVPCMNQWELDNGNYMPCPVLKQVKKLYDAGRDSEAQPRWKKYSWIYQGFVRQNPLDETDAPAIRRFHFGKQINDKIFDGMLDMDPNGEMPTHHTEGRDFIIKVRKSQNFRNYNSSVWAMSQSELTDEEHKAVKENELTDLSTLLFDKPTEEQSDAILGLYNASLEGDEYDPEIYAKYYRPAGVKAPDFSDTVKTMLNDHKERQESEKVEAVMEDKSTREIVNEAMENLKKREGK